MIGDAPVKDVSTMTIRQRRFLAILVLWLVCYLIAAFLASVLFGDRNPGGPAPWTVPVMQFIEVTKLVVIAAPLMFVTAALMYLIPLILAANWITKRFKDK